jgi:RNA polymerase sigma-70 factor (ECF subfamily)
MAVIDLARAGQYAPDSVGDGDSVRMEAGSVPKLRSTSGVGSRDERLETMVEQHFDLVWRSLRRLGVADNALDDAAQQVFIVAARKLDAIEVAGERAYLVGIATRVASDMRRTWARRREAPGEDPAERSDPQASTEELVDQKRARQMLDDILSAMPMDLRAAFTMFEIEGMSAPEIAVALAIPIGTVSSRLRRARQFFREQVESLAASKGRSRV